MADNRTLVERLDAFRKDQLHDRLKSLSAMAGELEGVSFVTMRDIGEAFDAEFIADYDHSFVAETPAHGLIDLVCPGCQQVIPDVALELIAVQTREGQLASRVKVKASSKAKVHVCGQSSLPKPAEPEVEGQATLDDLDPEPDEGEGAE